MTSSKQSSARRRSSNGTSGSAASRSPSRAKRSSDGSAMRRSTSCNKLLSLAALSHLGTADSFSLGSHSQHATRGSDTFPAPPALMRVQSCGPVPAPPALTRMQSCPNPGGDFDLEDFPDFGPTRSSMPNMPTFNLEEATAPLVDAAAKGMNFLRDVGTSVIPGMGADTGADGMNILSPVTEALGEAPIAITKAVAAAKSAEIAGRLFLMGQHMPEQGVAPLEVAFQVAFLAVSCNTVYQTVMPKIKEIQISKVFAPKKQAMESLSEGDQAAFQSLFEPAGMDWKQYCEMTQLQSMEWVTLESGESIKTDDTYWLCQGNIELEGERASTGGLIGEDHIAKTLGLFDGDVIPSKVAVAGAEGAKVLKMNTQNLEQMLQKDKSLRAPLGTILFSHLRGKLETATKNLDSKMSPI